jgi:hypothetical protein
MRRAAARSTASTASIALVLALIACGSSHHASSTDAGSRHDGAARKSDAAEDAALDVAPASNDAGHAPPGFTDVLMQHNDQARTGQNLTETVLTTSNVSARSFGKLWTLPVDGLIYAQPLVVTQTFVGGAMHDVLIVATMNNSVYAFDADAPGNPLWQVNLGPAVPSTMANIFTGNLNLQVQVGILSTHVIDRAAGRIYLARADFTNQTMGVKVHVLDLATGSDLPGSPATVSATVPGVDGPISFDPHYSSQRPGLLLLDGVVYVAFASYGDTQPFYGWIFSYAYADGKLAQTQPPFISSAGSNGAGFWNSGQGLLSDGQYVYGVTSNGRPGSSPTTQFPTYTEAFLELTPDLVVHDWFVPYNYEMMNGVDLDLGAGGPLLIPGTTPPLMAGGGKTGVLYLVDTTNMGHLGTTSNNDVQDFQATPNSIYCSPVVWTGDAAPKLYLWGTGDVLKQFVLADGKLDTTPAAAGSVSTPVVDGQDPCGVLSVSSNQGEDGTGIVWGVKPFSNPDHTTVTGTFYAFDALTLKQLWASSTDAARDAFGNYAKFVPPTVANGRVYLATHSKQLVVYGLLPDGGK